MAKSTAIGLSLCALALVAFLVVSAAFSGVANSIDTQHWVGNPLPPCFVDAKTCWGHLLGTDEVGRDMLARLIAGTRTSLLISLLALALEVAFALALALIARRMAFVRPLLVRLSEAISSVPSWPFVALISGISFNVGGPASVAPSLALWAAIVCWPGLWRLMLASWSLMPLLKKGARDWAAFILMFVTIDFFGWGVQPPTPSLGNMLWNMQANVQIAWWSAVLPAFCIFLLVLLIEIGARASHDDPIRA